MRNANVVLVLRPADDLVIVCGCQFFFPPSSIVLQFRLLTVFAISAQAGSLYETKEPDLKCQELRRSAHMFTGGM